MSVSAPLTVRSSFTQRRCGDGFAAIWRARAVASAIRSDGATRRSAKPISNAWRPEYKAPVRHISLALPSPTRWTRKCELASSGVTPILTNSMPNLASSEATMTSIGSIMVAPTPTQAPLTAAIRGFDERNRVIQSPTPSRRSARASSRPSPVIRALKLSWMSAPAQKPRPAPVTTIAPTSGSLLQSVIAACRSACI